MADTTYTLELLVTDEGKPFYPAVGVTETPSSDNAGYDVKVATSVIPMSDAKLIPLGLKARLLKETKYDEVTIVEDSHFTLEPRSSIYKTGFMMANGRGIIDKTYRGQLMAPLISVGQTQTSLQAGTRLFQILAPDLGHISKVVYVDSLPETVRGEGGFGSTGLK
jgi:deoxyuridine 5'-triphosphate nucleotidohydrolase